MAGKILKWIDSKVVTEHSESDKSTWSSKNRQKCIPTAHFLYSSLVLSSPPCVLVSFYFRKHCGMTYSCHCLTWSLVLISADANFQRDAYEIEFCHESLFSRKQLVLHPSTQHLYRVTLWSEKEEILSTNHENINSKINILFSFYLFPAGFKVLVK